MIANHVECHPLAYDTGKAFDIVRTSLTTSFGQGANPKQVATRAGHASVAFALDRYGHLFPEADEALMNGLDAVHRAATEAAGAGGAGFVRSQSGHGGVTPLLP